MEIVAGILAGMVLVLAGLWMREYKSKKKLEQKQKEQDQMLTQYVAKNLDMEKQLKDMTQDFEKQQSMAAEIKRIQQQIRSLKHDMKNHTLVILSYLEEEKPEEARVYAGELLDKLNKMYTYVNVGNSLLNHIMNHKLSEAKEAGIEIKAEIENCAFSFMDSVDFSALLNNLLDNAIAGALDSREKKLEVQISYQKGFDVITVKNSIDSSVLLNNPDLISTKEEAGHGLGMKQIKSIVEKYNGKIDIYEKNNKFVVSIMLG